MCTFRAFVLLFIAPLCVAGFAPLNITALASQDGVSIIQCWQLSTIPMEARSAMNYDLGNTTKATWSIIEPRTVAGEAWAPTVQCVEEWSDRRE